MTSYRQFRRCLKSYLFIVFLEITANCDYDFVRYRSTFTHLLTYLLIQCIPTASASLTYRHYIGTMLLEIDQRREQIRSNSISAGRRLDAGDWRVTDGHLGTFARTRRDVSFDSRAVDGITTGT